MVIIQFVQWPRQYLQLRNSGTQSIYLDFCTYFILLISCHYQQLVKTFEVSESPGKDPVKLYFTFFAY